jgi:hypothetical protein
MPAQHYPRRMGLKPSAPRQALPEPGTGGYPYPRGPYGKTGFPGSTPAAAKTHTQTVDGRRDRQLDTTDVWARDTGPEFLDVTPVEVPKPQPSHGSARFRPGIQPSRGNRFLRPGGDPRQPLARTGEETAVEQRSTPVIGADAPGSQNVRNQVAQRYKAVPGMWRPYRAAPNPGKTGAQLDGPSAYHPDTYVWGAPDGKPVPGDPGIPGGPPMVTVDSRFVSDEGAQEGYAVNRPLQFSRGGVAGWPPGYQGNAHLRGGRLSGQRYFGPFDDQQQIGLDSDAYGIARRRGPQHRPVRFEQPGPWTANYYDVSPEQGTQAPDMIVRSAGGQRRGHSVARGRPARAGSGGSSPVGRMPGSMRGRPRRG